LILKNKDFDEKTLSTTCKKKNLDPIWNEEFNFKVNIDENKMSTNSLLLEVYDMNFDIFGKAKLSDFMGIKKIK
jgi:Ca2+-dependent lipid-binding protein